MKITLPQLINKSYELIKNYINLNKEYSPHFQHIVQEICDDYKIYSDADYLDYYVSDSLKNIYKKADNFNIAHQFLPPRAVEDNVHIKFASIVLLEEFFMDSVNACEQVYDSVVNGWSLQVYKKALCKIHKTRVDAAYHTIFQPFLYLNWVINDFPDNFAQKSYALWYNDEPASEKLLFLVTSLRLELLNLE